MTVKDRSDIERNLGLIEGVAMCMPDEDARTAVLNAAAAISAILDKNEDS